MAALFLAFTCAALSFIPDAANYLNNGSVDSSIYKGVAHIAACLLCVILPFLLAMGPICVSRGEWSRCQTLDDSVKCTRLSLSGARFLGLSRRLNAECATLLNELNELRPEASPSLRVQIRDLEVRTGARACDCDSCLRPEHWYFGASYVDLFDADQQTPRNRFQSHGRYIGHAAVGATRCDTRRADLPALYRLAQGGTVCGVALLARAANDAAGKMVASLQRRL